MARFRKKTIRAMVMMVAYSSRRSIPPTYIGRRRSRCVTTPRRKTAPMASGRARYQRSGGSSVTSRAYWT